MKKVAIIFILGFVVLALIPEKVLAFSGIPHPVREIFSESERIEKKKVILTEDKREKIEKKLDRRVRGKNFTFYIGMTNGKTDGYALMLRERGKHGPITFIVVISPEGDIKKVIVHKEREREGKKIKRKRFLRQFIGKSINDLFKTGKSAIHTVTGATISSKAAIRASKKAILIWEAALKSIVD